MVFSLCLFWPRNSVWTEYSIEGIKFKVHPVKEEDFRRTPGIIPPYFWNKGFQPSIRQLLGRKPKQSQFPIHRGYTEARNLIRTGSVADVENLCLEAQDIVSKVFDNINNLSKSSMMLTESKTPIPEPKLVELSLSPDLASWREAQHLMGNILPPKKGGLTQASEEALEILGAADWPEAMKTNNALFGCGIASLLMGAADAETMFSNYVTDMAFYYEHGYDRIFPALEPLLDKALTDTHALRTPGGVERRDGVRVGKRYIQKKIALEKRFVSCLSNYSACLNRSEAQIVSLSESSLLGMATETLARGFDPAAVMSDLVFSSPGTDVVDVGCDLLNSEVMNSFLNTADITSTGVVSEEVLRRVYDAFAATGARMLTQRWYEPVARMSAALYTWHIQNDRHLFLRRALLGWPKARKTPAHPQCEADFDEAFDEGFRTTGFSRPLSLEYTCDGLDTCDHVTDFLQQNCKKALLRELWWYLVVGPLEYVRRSEVDEKREEELVEGSRLCMAKLFAEGTILEMVWLIAHASHHGWQVNYLFEAAMFGSILDGGQLVGKLDRQEDVSPRDDLEKV